MVVPALAFATAAGAAKGGNSANAAACQSGGWQILQTSTNSSFKNQGDCTSYGAHGGQFSSTCLGATPPETFADARIAGAPNTLNNVDFYQQSGDGTCGGPVSVNHLTLVVASTEADAVAICDSLGATSGHGLFASFGYATPNTWWLCG
jgi:hypothetical protein